MSITYEYMIYNSHSMNIDNRTMQDNIISIL